MNNCLNEYFDGVEMGRSFFDVDDEFFLINSNNLSNVYSRLYGYSVQNSGIYENENLTDEAIYNLNGCGCYVYVDMKDDEITIKQDFNGSWGIYFFQHNEYFAISNSFFKLLEHIKGKYSISLDRDYCNHFFVAPLASIACSETPVKEIKLIAKNAIIKINTKKKQLYFDYIDYKEDSFSLNSNEGLAILDHWFERWTTIFRKLKEKTNNIAIHLSGGFDSRISFLLFLCSGIDLNETMINSINDKLHTHAEDWKIASSIADYYGFKLNYHTFPESAMNYSLSDTINMAFYNKMGFHKQMYFKNKKFEEKRYLVSGAGGEAVRAYWDVPADKFIQDNVNRCNRYSQNLAKEMGKSVEKIIKHAYEVIDQKIYIDNPNSIKYPFNIYRENRCRSHFGKSAVEDYFSNQYTLQPLIDPELRKIRTSEPECHDNNLLMAMIYVRYCPKLLEFKFEGNRRIAQNTIEFAKEINNKFPYLPSNVMVSEDFNVVTRDYKVSEILEKNNTEVSTEIVNKCFKEAFNSVSFRNMFAMYFDEEIYSFAKQSYEKTDFYPLTNCYPSLAIGKVIENILVSENIIYPTPAQSLNYYIQNNNYDFYDQTDILRKFRNYITARIDIKLYSKEIADFEITDISDAKAILSRPASLQKDGTCIVIESCVGELDFNIKMKSEGKLKISLRGKYVLTEDKSTRIPYWIDYHSCEIDHLTEFSEIKPAWHDKPIYIFRDVVSSNEINIRLEWTPHRSDTIK